MCNGFIPRALVQVIPEDVADDNTSKLKPNTAQCPPLCIVTIFTNYRCFLLPLINFMLKNA